MDDGIIGEARRWDIYTSVQFLNVFSALSVVQVHTYVSRSLT